MSIGNSINERRSNTRRLDIDRAKGLGIVLVVLGHVVAREPPIGNDWYLLLKQIIYLFHMPFFMYLSGYVTFLSGAANLPLNRWADLVNQRFQRLLIPFLVFGILIVAGKLILGKFISVDNLPGSAGQALLDLIWTTERSPAFSVWYVAALFVMCVVTPPLMRLTGGQAYIVLMLALLIYFLPVPHRVYVDRVARYYVFFLMGGLAAEAGARWLGLIDRFFLSFILAFIFALLLFCEFGIDSTSIAALLVCGSLSMPALHGLVRRSVFEQSSILLSLGTFSFVIYLLNTPFIGLVKGIGTKFFPWHGENFFIYFPLLTCVGIVGPIIAKRYILSRSRIADRMTD